MGKLEDMQNFVEVVDAGSITRAAERSGQVKSAVSRRLSELEARLGVQLITRTTRRMTLTDAGRQFYESARRMASEVTEAEAAVGRTDAALSGRIRLAAPTVFGRRHLGPALVAFLEAHPGIELDVEFNDRHIDIVEEGFDVAVRITKLNDSRLIARRIARISAVIAASPAYWDKHGRPRRPPDLARHQALHYAYQSTTWRYRDSKGRAGGVRVPGALRANNGDFILEAATRGLGIIRQPRFIAHESIQAGLLEPVLTRHEWLDVAAYAIYPETRHLPRRIRALVDFLVNRWGEEPHWEQC